MHVAAVPTARLAAHIETRVVARDVASATLATWTIRATLIRLILELYVVAVGVLLVCREAAVQVFQ